MFRKKGATAYPAQPRMKPAGSIGLPVQVPILETIFAKRYGFRVTPDPGTRPLLFDAGTGAGVVRQMRVLACRSEFSWRNAAVWARKPRPTPLRGHTQLCFASAVFRSRMARIRCLCPAAAQLQEWGLQASRLARCATPVRPVGRPAQSKQEGQRPLARSVHSSWPAARPAPVRSRTVGTSGVYFQRCLTVLSSPFACVPTAPREDEVFETKRKAASHRRL
jgi:hypothetical protein